MTWDLQKPNNSQLKDHAIEFTDDKLKNFTVCLGICGSIAAYKSPDIIRELRKHGATVTAFASPSALNFVTKMALEWTSTNEVISSLSADAEHLGGEQNFNLYLFAPATYSTINKMANGIADTSVTIAFASALGALESKQASIFISPCMHGSMHNQILTRSMEKLQKMGVQFIRPRQEDGKNKLPEPIDLVDHVINALKK
jgi:phosphopantothenoylcysteine decarboxylase / phosphopantothenate---cysteine ligase